MKLDTVFVGLTAEEIRDSVLWLCQADNPEQLREPKSVEIRYSLIPPDKDEELDCCTRQLGCARSAPLETLLLDAARQISKCTVDEVHVLDEIPDGVAVEIDFIVTPLLYSVWDINIQAGRVEITWPRIVPEEKVPGIVVCRT